MKGRAKDHNLLFILSDQHKTGVAGCYGHPIVKTPHLDHLAAAGTRFTQAYCQSPLCGPSRGSLWTGMHCHTCGALTQKTPICDVPTVADVFRDAGYETASFGKMHTIGETADRDLGFTHRGLRYYTYEYRDYIEVIGENNVREYVGTGHGEWDKRGYNSENRPLALPEEEVFDRLVVDRCIEFLKEHKDRRFLLNVGIEKPHPSWYAPKEYHEMYSPADVIVPPDYDQPLANVPASMIRRQEYLESHTWAEQEVQNSIAAYYANVTYVDAQIGRLLAALQRLGLADKTLIVYTTDHGEILFEHGWVQKHCFFESAVSVPLLMVCPDVIPAGRAQDGIVSLLDLFPTFTDLFGLETPDGLEGASLLELLAGRAETAGREAFSEYYWTCDPARMIRTDRWKYIYTQGEIPQLYDMANDPSETRNLAADPKFSSTCAELEEKVMAGWKIPVLDIDLTAKESRYRAKEEYLRRRAAGEP